jgi:glycosyltransferase involved in cell wall biosynthesis
MELSILIPTMQGREHFLSELLFHLNWQINTTYKENVEVITDKEDYFNIGEKRNSMLLHAKGKFVVFIDDDDDISSDYISSFVDAIKSDPDADCIGYRGFITFNGEGRKEWSISKTHKLWHEKNNIYYRTPNHISPVKTEIAKKSGFPSLSVGEDYEYSMRIFPHLKKEVFINKELYHYRYVEKK